MRNLKPCKRVISYFVERYAPLRDGHRVFSRHCFNPKSSLLPDIPFLSSTTTPFQYINICCYFLL